MPNLLRSRTRKATFAPVPAAIPERRRPVLRRPRDRAAVGFRVGGAGLGAVGCALGASAPYAHPLAIVLSTLWWGLYLAALGGSLGALVCWFTARKPPPAQGEG
jgi:hypothetical protein